MVGKTKNEIVLTSIFNSNVYLSNGALKNLPPPPGNRARVIGMQGEHSKHCANSYSLVVERRCKLYQSTCWVEPPASSEECRQRMAFTWEHINAYHYVTHTHNCMMRFVTDAESVKGFLSYIITNRSKY